MKALRYHGRTNVRIDEVDEPRPGPGQVTVDIAVAGICGTDVHEYKGGPIAIPLTESHPLTGQHAPVVLGHEFSGRVKELGTDVAGLSVGQRVAGSAVISCGNCPSCTDGHRHLCATLGFHGLSGDGGAFASVDVIDADLLHIIPESVSDEVGALLEPLATGVHAVARSGIGRGASVLIVGGGPIGLMTAVAALAAGAAQVIVSEPSKARASAAARLGATTVLDPFAVDVTAEARRLTDGLGVDAAFDAAAVATSFGTALGSLRPRGVLVNVAVWEQPTPLQPNALLFTEATITGALAYTHDEFERAIEIAASGQFELETLVSRRISLADAVSEGFERLATAPGDDIKVLVTP
ncbi:MAG: 2,3-butanediol dehydrogenase [Aeromicrobium sp.]